MKKILLFVILFAFATWVQAAVATDPVVDLGTLTFTTDTPTAWTFSVSDHAAGTITQSGTGALYASGNYTPFNLSNLQNKDTHAMSISK